VLLARCVCDEQRCLLLVRLLRVLNNEKLRRSTPLRPNHRRAASGVNLSYTLTDMRCVQSLKSMERQNEEYIFFSESRVFERCSTIYNLQSTIKNLLSTGTLLSFIRYGLWPFSCFPCFTLIFCCHLHLSCFVFQER
jgi:hypothetical protein